MRQPPTRTYWLQRFDFFHGQYPACWKKGHVQKVLLDWANHRCEVCDRGLDQVSLHVHHLTWADKHDCRWINLLVCCRACHVQLHNRRWQPGQKWESRWGEVPEWAIARGLLDNAGNPVSSIDVAAIAT